MSLSERIVTTLLEQSDTASAYLADTIEDYFESNPDGNVSEKDLIRDACEDMIETARGVLALLEKEPT